MYLYEEPYDPLRPVVCFDERPCQLLAEIRDQLPIAPGRPRRFDSHYERGGMVHVLMAFEPLSGWYERGPVTEGKRNLTWRTVRHPLAVVSPSELGFEALPTTTSSNTSPLSFKVRSTTPPDSSTTCCTV